MCMDAVELARYQGQSVMSLYVYRITYFGWTYLLPDYSWLDKAQHSHAQRHHGGHGNEEDPCLGL